MNNAGMSPLYESLDAVTEELFDKTVAVNLKGPFRLGGAAATTWPPTTAARSSTSARPASLIASVDELPYACAKAGLNAFTVGLGRSVRAEGPGKRHPARPVPHRHQRGLERRPGADGSFVPLGGWESGRGRAAGPAPRFSAASSYTTGAIIRVDGGITRKV